MENPQPRMLTADEVREMKRQCTPSFQVLIQQVGGGFKLIGVIEWSKDGAGVAKQNDEAVAMDWQDAMVKVHNYYSEYAFIVPNEAAPSPKGNRKERRTAKARTPKKTAAKVAD